MRRMMHITISKAMVAAMVQSLWAVHTHIHPAMSLPHHTIHCRSSVNKCELYSNNIFPIRY